MANTHDRIQAQYLNRYALRAVTIDLRGVQLTPTMIAVLGSGGTLREAFGDASASPAKPMG